jgi:hypothetical protein
MHARKRIPVKPEPNVNRNTRIRHLFDQGLKDHEIQEVLFKEFGTTLRVVRNVIDRTKQTRDKALRRPVAGVELAAINLRLDRIERRLEDIVMLIGALALDTGDGLTSVQRRIGAPVTQTRHRISSRPTFVPAARKSVHDIQA